MQPEVTDSGELRRRVGQCRQRGQYRRQFRDIAQRTLATLQLVSGVLGDMHDTAEGFEARLRSASPISTARKIHYGRWCSGWRPTRTK